MDGFYRGTICTEERGCRTDPAFPAPGGHL
jgi:hypothetical protein